MKNKYAQNREIVLLYKINIVTFQIFKVFITTDNLWVIVMIKSIPNEW